MVKIPGTVEGAPVIEEMLAEGININITLLFSIDAYERVAVAYIDAPCSAGTTQASRSTASPRSPRSSSAASTPLVDKLLDAESASDEGHWRLKGKVAVANAKLAYEKFEELFGSEQLRGAAPPRAPRRSARSGPAPAPRTRPTPTRSTSTR